MIFDPNGGLLEFYQLKNRRYELKQPDENGRHWIDSMGLFLGTWQGTKEARTGYWLRWWNGAGNLLFWAVEQIEQERQADTLGTRLIVASGYAADGLRNLMVTLEKQQKNALPSWLSSHPGGNQRVSDLENLITRNSYNRYAYEGVGRHGEIQARVKKLLQKKKAREEKK